MIPNSSKNRPDPKTVVLEALARLRALFPLEQRLHTTPQPVRVTYVQVLAYWLRATPPSAPAFDANALAALIKQDALVPEEHGLGCYPFSTIDTGIRVALPGGTVNAMCAIDALAIARLAGSAVTIAAGCTVCGGAVTCRVEADGSLDHDQTEVARVLWKDAAPAPGAAADNLCRNLLFLCPACEPPAGDQGFTLPQATVIGNAFFSFQIALMRETLDLPA